MVKGKSLTAEFVEVTFDEVPARHYGAGTGHPTALSLKLETGVPVFLPGETGKSVGRLRSKEGYLARKGFKIKTVAGEHGGVKGMFVWAVKPEEDNGRNGES